VRIKRLRLPPATDKPTVEHVYVPMTCPCEDQAKWLWQRSTDFSMMITCERGHDYIVRMERA
jgi:hypothetical protein